MTVTDCVEMGIEAAAQHALDVAWDGQSAIVILEAITAPGAARSSETAIMSCPACARAAATGLAPLLTVCDRETAVAGQLCVALVFAEPASNWPLAGCIYRWSRRLAGEIVGRPAPAAVPAVAAVAEA